MRLDSNLGRLTPQTDANDWATATCSDEMTVVCRYPSVRSLKQEGSTAVERRLSVARDLAGDMARLAACELGRMFEYQLALINEPIAVRMLARHAVDCILQASDHADRWMKQVAAILIAKGRIAAAN